MWMNSKHNYGQEYGGLESMVAEMNEESRI